MDVVDAMLEDRTQIQRRRRCSPRVFLSAPPTFCLSIFRFHYLSASRSQFFQRNTSAIINVKRSVQDFNLFPRVLLLGRRKCPPELLLVKPPTAIIVEHPEEALDIPFRLPAAQGWASALAATMDLLRFECLAAAEASKRRWCETRVAPLANSGKIRRGQPVVLRDHQDGQRRNHGDHECRHLLHPDGWGVSFKNRTGHPPSANNLSGSGC